MDEQDRQQSTCGQALCPHTPRPAPDPWTQRHAGRSTGAGAALLISPTFQF